MTVEFLGIKRMTQEAKTEAENIIRNGFGEIGCELAGHSLLEWVPNRRGFLETEDFDSSRTKEYLESMAEQVLRKGD